jgi:uncharacterized membrane protein
MAKAPRPRIPNYLLAGILTVVPLWITWLVFEFVFRLLSKLGTPWVNALARGIGESWPNLTEALLHPWLQPTVAVIITLVGLYLLGWVTTRVVGKRVVNSFDQLMVRIPFVQRIYGSTKKLLAALNREPGKLERVVLIDFPNESMKAVGFVTRIIHDSRSGRDLAAVYVPTTPNPTSGYLEIVPTDLLVTTDMTVEEAMTFIISGGAVGPDSIGFQRSG